MSFTINSRMIAILIASTSAAVTAAFMTLFKESTPLLILVTGLISFSATFMFTYISLEFLFFRELNKLHDGLGRLKSNTPEEIDPVSLRDQYGGNPLKRIKDKIQEYVERKEEEIDRLKKMEVYRREFLANVSHELKTPIFATQGYILTLLDGAYDDPNVRKKFLKKAAKSLSGLDHLVEDLLTISKMESGDITMKYEVFDFQDLIADVFDQTQRKAKKNQVLLDYKPPHDDAIYVNADYNRMMQVLINLVTNAIKYNKQGGKVSLIVEDNEKEMKVSVRDNGMGIPLEDQLRVFERFYRVEKSRVKTKGGTGLGLAIAKHILEEHNSQIDLESEVGKGSTFSFKLVKHTEDEANEI